MSITRRTILGGLAALAAPAVNATATEEAAFDLQHWIETADPHEVAVYLGKQLALTMAKANPERSWRSVIDHEHNFALICGDPV